MKSYLMFFGGVVVSLVVVHFYKAAALPGASLLS
jgi:hypothetical protein